MAFRNSDLEGEFSLKTFILLIVIGFIGFAVFRSIQANKTENADFRNIKKLPPSVQSTVAKMDSATQTTFFNELDKRRKKLATGYIIWAIFGWHYIYTGKIGLQFAFWFTFGGLGIWWVADFFRLPSIIRSANEIISREVIQTLAMGTAFAGGVSQ